MEKGIQFEFNMRSRVTPSFVMFVIDSKVDKLSTETEPLGLFSVTMKQETVNLMA